MQVIFHKDFKKQYKHLPPAMRKRCDERIGLFVKNPFHAVLNNHALSGEYENYRSINISGDLRAIYESIAEDKAFFIILGTHSELYE